MVGNVWEWTSDWFSPVHFLTEENQQIGFVDPTGPSVEDLEQLVPPQKWWESPGRFGASAGSVMIINVY